MCLQLLAFESYRDLVRLLQQNLSEEQGLILAELQNVEERALARSAAPAGAPSVIIISHDCEMVMPWFGAVLCHACTVISNACRMPRTSPTEGALLSNC